MFVFEKFTSEELIDLAQLESEMLDLTDYADELTRSDLQSVVGALVYKIVLFAKKLDAEKIK